MYRSFWDSNFSYRGNQRITESWIVDAAWHADRLSALAMAAASIRRPWVRLLATDAKRDQPHAPFSCLELGSRQPTIPYTSWGNRRS